MKICVLEKKTFGKKTKSKMGKQTLLSSSYYYYDYSLMTSMTLNQSVLNGKKMKGKFSVIETHRESYTWGI